MPAMSTMRFTLEVPKALVSQVSDTWHLHRLGTPISALTNDERTIESEVAKPLTTLSAYFMISETSSPPSDTCAKRAREREVAGRQIEGGGQKWAGRERRETDSRRSGRGKARCGASARAPRALLRLLTLGDAGRDVENAMACESECGACVRVSVRE
eukprot:6192614-Pleurochrysis_carterae.AAC.2